MSNETPKVRKSRLQSWLGESGEHKESESDGQNGPDSKELSGLVLDSVHSDESESKAQEQQPVREKGYRTSGQARRAVQCGASLAAAGFLVAIF